MRNGAQFPRRNCAAFFPIRRPNSARMWKTRARRAEKSSGDGPPGPFGAPPGRHAPGSPGSQRAAGNAIPGTAEPLSPEPAIPGTAIPGLGRMLGFAHVSRTGAALGKNLPHGHLPGFFRPSHAGARGHHPAGRPAVRPGHCRGAPQHREGAAFHGSGAARVHSRDLRGRSPGGSGRLLGAARGLCPPSAARPPSCAGSGPFPISSTSSRWRS